MTKKLLWYPWHWERWMASYEALQLTWAERGVYRELLDASWRDGGLPNDPTKLAKLARGPLVEFKRTWKAVRRFWHQGTDGLLYNATLEEIRAEQSARHAKLVESGRRGGRVAQATLKGRSRVAQAIEKSRVETTLPLAAGGRFESAAAPPSDGRCTCPDERCPTHGF